MKENVIYDLTVCSPEKLSGDEIETCLDIIKEGEAVDLEYATEQLPQAKHVAVVRLGQKIVAVGAVKQRRPNYAVKIASDSGFSFDNNIHELGYVAVTKSAQGNQISDRIAEALLAKMEGLPLFATTFNERMIKALTKAGFVQRGREWRRKQGGQMLSLWIKGNTPK